MANVVGTVNGDNDTVHFEGWNLHDFTGIVIASNGYLKFNFVNALEQSGSVTVRDHQNLENFIFADGTQVDGRHFGTFGADTIDGDSSDDIVFGFGGDDRIFGGGGNNTLYGGDGKDLLRGGSGDDVLHAGGNTGSGEEYLDG